MSKLVRFGVSIEESLLRHFDSLIAKRKYTNRSEAIRDLIRNQLVDLDWKDDSAIVVGAVTIVYDHHVRELVNRLTDIQHEYAESIISSLHVHLDEHNCLEVIVLKGRAGRVREVADALIGLKGVKHGRLISTTTGSRI